MLFASMSDWLDDERAKYVIYGVLILLVIGSLTLTFATVFSSPGSSDTPRELHFRCQETGKEFALKPQDISPEDSDAMEQAGPFARLKNPETGRATLVPMMECPKCEKYFVPEAWKQAPGAGSRGQSPDAATDPICPYCGTDVFKWRREHRRR